MSESQRGGSTAVDARPIGLAAISVAEKQHANYFARLMPAERCNLGEKTIDLHRWLNRRRRIRGGAMKKAKAKKAGSPGKAAAKKASPSGTKGCCTIIFEDKKAEQVEGVTQAACTRLARASGGVGQWNKGACA
jgi:hypothetical protein